MSEYSAVRGGQLKLKGKAGSQFRKKKSKRKRGDSTSERTGALGELKHGKSEFCLNSLSGHTLSNLWRTFWLNSKV